MTTPDWTAVLADPTPIRTALGNPAPALTELVLFCVHLDERDASITLIFQCRRAPAVAIGERSEHGHNAMEFSLVLKGVSDLQVEGWTHEPMTAVTLTAGSAVLSGPGQRISFSYEVALATGVRSFRASPTSVAVPPGQ